MLDLRDAVEGELRNALVRRSAAVPAAARARKLEDAALDYLHGQPLYYPAAAAPREDKPFGRLRRESSPLRASDAQVAPGLFPARV